MVVKSSVLKELEECYREPGNQLVVLYGRTDSEKERLLGAFVQNKKHFYYRARQVAEREQRAQMGRELAAQFEVTPQKYTYEEYFNRVKSGEPTKLVVVIDEFQYIAKKDPTFMEAVLKLKAHRLYPGPVMILLCSSAVSWAERELTECIGEAACRKIDRKIKFTNLNFLEVVRALPEYPVAECIKTYGIIGGVPGYINRWNAKADVKTNICRLILSPGGYLYHAAEDLIGESLRELSVYETILAQIAAGQDKLNDLYRTTGFSRAKISVYMKNLAAFDIIQKVVSFETGGWENTKKGVYRIRDNYVNFWFRFVYPHLSDLYMMTPEEFYDTYIEKDLDDYMNRYFVKVCREYLTLLNRIGKLPINIHRIGTWVGKKGNIDIVAQNSVRESIVGICNWSEPYMTRSSGEALLDNLKQAKISAKYLYMFSAQEFAEDLKQMAEEDKRFVLIDMKEL